MVLLLLTTAPVASAKLPHIVFLLTDDQDVMLGGLDHMPQLRRLLQDQGTTMTAAYAVSVFNAKKWHQTDPCCPRRARLATRLAGCACLSSHAVLAVVIPSRPVSTSCPGLAVTDVAAPSGPCRRPRTRCAVRPVMSSSSCYPRASNALHPAPPRCPYRSAT